MRMSARKRHARRQLAWKIIIVAQLADPIMRECQTSSERSLFRCFEEVFCFQEMCRGIRFKSVSRVWLTTNVERKIWLETMSFEVMRINACLVISKELSVTKIRARKQVKDSGVLFFFLTISNIRKIRIFLRELCLYVSVWAFETKAGKIHWRCPLQNIRIENLWQGIVPTCEMGTQLRTGTQTCWSQYWQYLDSVLLFWQIKLVH